jgi:hypothetical protein
MITLIFVILARLNRFPETATRVFKIIFGAILAAGQFRIRDTILVAFTIRGTIMYTFQFTSDCFQTTWWFLVSFHINKKLNIALGCHKFQS